MRGLFKQGILVACLVTVACVAGGPGTASAGKDPPYLPITDLLPPLPGPGGRDPGIPCENGSPRCVDRTLKQMQRRLRRDRCDHKGLFLANYIVVTEGLRQDRPEPERQAPLGLLRRPRLARARGRLFARQYFVARDWWASRRRETAWTPRGGWPSGRPTSAR